jgi:CoA:oxalate CoA-transferase
MLGEGVLRMTDGEGPGEARTLDGIRVADLSRAISGPYAGRILADLGADVVKIESPRGDVADEFGRRQAGRSGLFAQMNAGKRIVRLDLADDAGRQSARLLLRCADVVIENFRPGVLDGLGLGYQDLEAGNPGVVLLSISGFGASGPEAGRRAFAPVIHAESGLLIRNAVGTSGTPSDLPIALADTLSALHGTIAVLAALRLRDVTGHGQHIDMSMLAAVTASDDHVHHALEGDPRTMPSRGLIWEAPGGPILLALEMGATWTRLRAVFGLNDDEATADLPLADKHAARVIIVANWIRGFGSRQQLIEALEAAKIGWADARRPEDLLGQASLQAQPPFAEVADGGDGTRRVIRMPYRFSHAADVVPGGVKPAVSDLAPILAEWAHASSRVLARPDSVPAQGQRHPDGQPRAQGAR